MWNASPFQFPSVYHSPSTKDGYVTVTGDGYQNYGSFFGVIVENTNASTRYLQVFDGYTVPNNGTVPIMSIKLTTNTQQIIFLPTGLPLQFFNGLTLVSSSTGPTLTKAGLDFFLTVFYLSTKA